MDRKFYYDAVARMQEANADPEYIQGWVGGYMGNPKREEQRITEAYEAGYEAARAGTPRDSNRGGPAPERLPGGDRGGVEGLAARAPDRVHRAAGGRGAAHRGGDGGLGGALADPDEDGVPFTAVVHFGPERARDLQRLYFDQKALAAELTGQTGVVWRDALGMDDSIAIVQPYDQFGADESLHDRVNRAIETLRGRAERLAETIAAL